MKNGLYHLAVIGALTGLVASVPGAAQDLQRTYQLGPGSHIQVSNVSGNLIVTGYNGSAVIVTAWKEGHDRDLAEIEDLSGADRVQLRVRYPEHCNCDVSVKFQVQVPRSISLDFDHISSVSGNVEISGVSGQVRAKSVSGDVHVKDVTGTVSASSVSGNVETTIGRLEGAGDMKFSSVSGNVDVRVPANLDANVEMSTMSGSLKTDFPLEVREKRNGPGHSVRGQVGGGSYKLVVTSVSGNVTLTRS